MSPVLIKIPPRNRDKDWQAQLNKNRGDDRKPGVFPFLSLGDKRGHDKTRARRNDRSQLIAGAAGTGARFVSPSAKWDPPLNEASPSLAVADVKRGRFAETEHPWSPHVVATPHNKTI